MIKRKKGTVKKDSNAKKAGVGIYRDIPYESYNELYTLHWLYELLDEGFILTIERSRSFQLTSGLKNVYEVKTKKGSKVVEQTILKPSVYTPDFMVSWNPDKYNKFVQLLNTNEKIEKILIGYIPPISFSEVSEIITCIETKPSFSAENMLRVFINNQKFLYKTHGILANLFQPDKIFNLTFTPKESMTTKTGRDRKIKHTIRSLEEFLKL